jgi:hypothetical protein
MATTSNKLHCELYVYIVQSDDDRQALINELNNYDVAPNKDRSPNKCKLLSAPSASIMDIMAHLSTHYDRKDRVVLITDSHVMLNYLGSQFKTDHISVCLQSWSTLMVQQPKALSYGRNRDYLMINYGRVVTVYDDIKEITKIIIARFNLMLVK